VRVEHGVYTIIAPVTAVGGGADLDVDEVAATSATHGSMEKAWLGEIMAKRDRR
jgi:hypothetical protein